MNTSINTFSKKPLRRLSKKYDLIEFLRPTSFWPQPYTIEDAYLLLTHILREGADLREQHRWGVASIWDTVSGSSGYGPHHLELTSPTSIREAWTNLLLRKGPTTIEKWKSDNNLTPSSTISASTYRHKPFESALRWSCEGEINKAFERFFTFYTKKNTTVSLNSMHPDAIEIFHTSIIITKTSTIFRLKYGIRSSYGGYSCWNEVLTTTGERESILHGLERAIDLLDLLTKEDPDNKTVLEITDHLNKHTVACIKNSAFRLAKNNQPIISPFRPLNAHQQITA